MRLDSVIPRPELRALLVERLTTTGVLLYGPRRIGKSTLLEELASDPPHGWHAVRVDLEGCLEDPVRGLADELRRRLGAASLVVGPTLADRVSSLEVAGVGATLRDPSPVAAWAAVEDDLGTALAALGDQQLVVGFDEVPWWLDAITEREGPAGARAALAVLRRLRQRPEFAQRLRFVLTGSIGLAGLAQAIGASAEINDLGTVVVDPMTPVEGATLFETELLARSRRCSSAAATYAATLAGGSPHWIKVLAAAVGPGGAPGVADVDAAAETLLVPAQRKSFADEASEHFRRRHPELRTALVAILDGLSGADGGHPLEAAITAGIAAQPGLSRAQARDCVWLLADGFYLHLDPGDRLSWVNPLFRRWWLRYGGT